MTSCTVTGLVTVAMPPTATDLQVVVLQTTVFASNVALNLYGSLLITIRLILHRRMMVARLGPNAPIARYLHVVSILVESAILNTLVMIAAEIGNRYGLGFEYACVLISVTFQVCE